MMNASDRANGGLNEDYHTGSTQSRGKSPFDFQFDSD